MARMRWIVLAAVLVIGLLQLGAVAIPGLPLAVQRVAAEETDPLVAWRQVLATATGLKSGTTTLERPVTAFPGLILVPATTNFSHLQAGEHTNSRGEELYAIDTGDTAVWAFSGRRVYDSFWANPDARCQGTASYCVFPPDKESTDERFGGLTARGQPASATHTVRTNGSQLWQVGWYDPDADAIYELWLWGSAAKGIGAPAKIGQDNAVYAARIADSAKTLLAPYAGTVEGITALRDLGEQALAAGNQAAVRPVANALLSQVQALAASPAQGAPEAAVAYQRTTREWAELLFGGAVQAYWELWRQDAQALANAVDYPALERALAEAEAEQRRLESVVPASLLAGWYQQALGNLTTEIALGRQIAAGLITVDDASALGWGIVPIFPAVSDLPIDAGLLPVPQEFQVAGPEPEQVYYNVPPNTLWGVAKAVGPSCGLYPSPYGASRGIVRWGTYGYSGCVNPAAPDQVAAFQPLVAPTLTVTPVPAERPTLVPTPPAVAPTATPVPLARWAGYWTGTFSGSQRGKISFSAVDCSSSLSGKASLYITERGGNVTVEANFDGGRHHYGDGCRPFPLSGTFTAPAPGSGFTYAGSDIQGYYYERVTCRITGSQITASTISGAVTCAFDTVSYRNYGFAGTETVDLTYQVQR